MTMKKSSICSIDNGLVAVLGSAKLKRRMASCEFVATILRCYLKKSWARAVNFVPRHDVYVVRAKMGKLRKK